MTGIVIVGAGRAGCSAALALREGGCESAVTLVGDEAAWPYERPPLSKAQLVADAGDPPPLAEAARLEAAGVEFLRGIAVRQVDAEARQAVLADGRRLGFESLLFATGGGARPLAVPGGDLALGLRTHADALALRRRLAMAAGAPHGRLPRLVVVGAGVIGLEVAASARQSGWQVQVLEQGPRPLARLVPAAIGDAVARVHRAAGVELHFGVALHALAATAGGRIVVEAGAASSEADLVVAGIGLAPHTALAAAAGVRLEAGGIAVDSHGRTNRPGLFAAGDVAAPWHPRFGRRLRLESWQHAARHAAVVARNMLGGDEAYDEVPWSWSDQYAHNLQFVGLPCDGEQLVVRGSLDGDRYAALHLREGRLVGATLFNLGREMRPCKALIESGAVLDAARLADESLPLRTLAAGQPAAAASATVASPTAV